MQIATKEDVKSVMEIAKFYYKKGIMGYYPAIVYYSAVDRGCLWIEKFEGSVEGFVMVRPMKRTPILRVVQIAKRQGSSAKGTLLLQQAELYARKINLKSVVLNAKKVNVEAIKFYTKMGYVECGEKDDQIILQKGIL